MKYSKLLDKKVLTTKEASVLIGVSLPSIINWADAEKFSSFKTPGGHRRIPTDGFLRFATEKGYLLQHMHQRSEEKSGKSIVIIDTDKGYLETLQDYVRILSSEDVNVHTCSSAFWAGVLVAQKNPDILIVDYVKNILPKDFEQNWKSTFPNLKVVMLTHSLDPATLQQVSSEYILLNKGNSIQDVSKAICSLL